MGQGRVGKGKKGKGEGREGKGRGRVGPPSESLAPHYYFPGAGAVNSSAVRCPILLKKLAGWCIT